MNSSFASDLPQDREYPSMTVAPRDAQQVSDSADGSCQRAPTPAVRVIEHLMQSAEKRGDKEEARRYWREMQALIAEGARA